MSLWKTITVVTSSVPTVLTHLWVSRVPKPSVSLFNQGISHYEKTNSTWREKERETKVWFSNVEGRQLDRITQLNLLNEGKTERLCRSVGCKVVGWRCEGSLSSGTLRGIHWGTGVCACVWVCRWVSSSRLPVAEERRGDERPGWCSTIGSTGSRWTWRSPACWWGPQADVALLWCVYTPCTRPSWACGPPSARSCGDGRCNAEQFHPFSWPTVCFPSE